jgi:hypothetical protein
MTVAAAIAAVALAGKPAVAQVTTATVAATVKDGQGAVVPGATAVLIGEPRAIRVAEADQTVRNAQPFPNGQIDPARPTPRTAGFGAATGAAAMRSIQLQLRVQF